MVCYNGNKLQKCLNLLFIAVLHYMYKLMHSVQNEVYNMVPGQLTPNHLTPESSHTIFGQLTLYMK